MITRAVTPLMRIVLALCGVLIAAPTPAQAPFQFGVGIHVGQNKNSLPATQAALTQAGFNSFRDEVFWHRLEKKPGVLEFPDSLKDLDQLVTQSASAGRRPLLILDYGNPLYDGGGQLSSPQGIAAYVRYVRFVVKHFRGRVDQFEVWNEWNIGGGGTPAQHKARYGDPVAYASVLRAAYAAIKAENPSATVIGGAFAGFDYRWIDSFAKAGGLSSLDGFSIHPYVFSAGRSGTPEAAMKHLDELKARLEQLAPGRNVPVYITEAGWPSHQGANGVSEETVAAYLKSFMLLAKARPWIVGVWWYDLFDDGNDEQDKEHRFGLLTRDGAPKPAFRAISGFKSQLVSPVPRAPTDVRIP